MSRPFVIITCLVLCVSIYAAQKGKAGADYYPLGYSGDTWTGDIVAIDNEQRTLTLTHGAGKDLVKFIASIPDAPYEWTRDIHNARVLDFPYDKNSKSQVFKYDGPGVAAPLLRGPEGDQNSHEIKRKPNPPDANRIGDFADFMGRTIIVFYTSRERKDGANTVKYNDVWRVHVLPSKK